jgi:hypothetical protein
MLMRLGRGLSGAIRRLPLRFVLTVEAGAFLAAENGNSLSLE